MYNSKSDQSGGFPDALASQEEKLTKEYGLKYAKAIEGQWGSMDSTSSTYGGRKRVFGRNRDYANGTQDTSIYKQMLNAVDPNNGDGSLMNLDFTSVPVLPKFVRIVVNKILSRNPYPNLEAVDPLSSSEKNREKNRIKNQIKLRPQLEMLKEMAGGDVLVGEDPANIPETVEEAEIMMDTNIKTDAEIAAQVATDLTLSWNNFEDNTFRRCVNDLASLGMSVVKRSNDPNYGVKVDYVDPCNFIHSYTEDPSLDDLVYAGHVKEIPLHELKRLAGDELTEKDLEKITKSAKRASSNRSPNTPYGTTRIERDKYSSYVVQVMEFEFLSVDTMYFEEKENRYGNTNFFYEGFSYKERKGSVYERTPHSMEVETVYSGMYIIGTDHVLKYGRQANVPKNMHDISRARLSYSAVAVNLKEQVPKSMVDSCIGFADMLQLTHLKLQQAIAKAKPDGLIIDIEGLENVQLGKGGELQPLELHDIYEQTGVFYYRSKNPEGGFQNPPVREIGNSIRNINELIGLYNHYLRMIRDTTGINEVVDASTPKSDALVGVREQAIAASNNATYDVTNAAMVLYKKVCEDVVKCLQILPPESVIFKAYENAIGETNMSVLSSFSNLPMYNFGVQVQREMEDKDRMYLEQNIQVALSQKEIDLEDAMAVRALKDINQAERLLVVRRKKRIKKQQEMAAQNSQMQAQVAQQSAMATSQARQQEMQMEAQLEAQKIQLQTQSEIAIAQAKHEMEKEIEQMRIMGRNAVRGSDQNFRAQLESQKDDRKDERVKKQAVEQSKLIAQRKGERGAIQEAEDTQFDITQLL
jgi:hypothetical protein